MKEGHEAHCFVTFFFVIFVVMKKISSVSIDNTLKEALSDPEILLGYFLDLLSEEDSQAREKLLILGLTDFERMNLSIKIGYSF